jgi:hypothetical protein
MDKARKKQRERMPAFVLGESEKERGVRLRL